MVNLPFEALQSSRYWGRKGEQAGPHGSKAGGGVFRSDAGEAVFLSSLDARLPLVLH